MFAHAVSEGLLKTALDRTLAPELEGDPRNPESPHSSDTQGNGNGEREKPKTKATAKK